MAREVMGQPAEALPAFHYVRVAGYHVNIVVIQPLYIHALVLNLVDPLLPKLLCRILLYHENIEKGSFVWH